ncbi:hypothetical protein JCM8202_000417 [Rhodotorula sphaerocarpa]
MPPKSERQARKEEPLPDVPTDTKEPSLAVSQPHVAPDQATKSKTKRSKSSASNKRKLAAKEAAIERAHKLDKRKTEASGRKENKKKARQLWQ